MEIEKRDVLSKLVLLPSVSIEYAHIYTNHEITIEHQASLQLMKTAHEHLLTSRRRAARVVMVDDYSFPNPMFKYEQFAAWLSENQSTPDVIIRESQLIPLCDVVIKMIKRPKLQAELIRYIRTKRYPCSLFITAWYFVRLGYLPHPLFRDDYTAHSLLNILPEKYRPFEEKAMEIIQHTPYAACLENIQHSYYTYES